MRERRSLVGEGGSKDQAFNQKSLAEQSTSEKGSRSSHSNGGGSSGGSNHESGCGGGDNGAQKAEKGQAKDKFGFHLK